MLPVNRFIQRISPLLLLLAFLPGCRQDTTFLGAQIPDRTFVDFTLTDQAGRPFTLSAHLDKPTLMFFGYTFCPDVCPLTLSNWRKIETALGPNADRVNFVYVSVDPERDTPAQMKNHLATFSSRFVGLTGNREALQAVYAAFGVYREKVKIAENATGYLMTHTSSMYLLDKSGVWRLQHANDAKPEDVAHDLRLLLKQENVH